MIKTNFVILIILSCTLFSQTHIPAGDVSGTWTYENSPYYIDGEIEITNGETLTIEPGIDVVFTGHYTLSILGRLLSIGTEDNLITFTSQNPETGWNGIYLNANAVIDSSKIEFSIIQFFNTYGNMRCPILVNFDSKLLLKNSIIRNNISSSNSCGIITLHGFSLTLKRNQIYNNFVEGSSESIILCFLGVPYIEDNIIRDNFGDVIINMV